MTTIHRALPTGLAPADPDELLRLTLLLAHDERLPELLDLTSPERSWARLEATDLMEVWLIGWPPGTATGWHDHQGSSGAFRVVHGALTEHTWDRGPRTRDLARGEGRSFAASHVHDVRNEGSTAAVSVHAYAPALRGMTRYAVAGGALVRQQVERAGQW